jgi:hypothetical protein
MTKGTLGTVETAAGEIMACFPGPSGHHPA